MEEEKLSYSKNEILRVLRDLELLVVSMDRIGSAFHDREGDEQYNSMFVRVFDEMDFFRRLSSARSALSEPFSTEVGEDGMDELERNAQGLHYWNDTK